MTTIHLHHASEKYEEILTGLMISAGIDFMKAHDNGRRRVEIEANDETVDRLLKDAFELNV